ncbi:uncharacterized protein [Aristolochia californica]|uniref:uncharacterized protein n=1 Tax=Aristolochia californica TaxID=171875 RepID=UPI0035D7BFA7
MYAYGKIPTMANNFGPQQFHLTHERTQQMEPSSKVESQVAMANHLASLQLPETNQKIPKMDPSPPVKIQPTVVYNFASLQVPLANKRALRMDLSPKYQPQSSMPKLKPNIHNNTFTEQLPATNKRTLQMEPSPKVQSRSFESVRSKLRESLAAALALVGHSQNAALDVGKMPQNKSENVFILGEANPQPVDSSSVGTNVAASPMPERPSGTIMSTTSEPDGSHTEGQGPWHESSFNENKVEGPKVWACEQECQSKHIFPEDASFIIKDDLLQGNGLYWASEPDFVSYEINDKHNTKRLKLDHVVEVPHDDRENMVKRPETLAVKIEEELFKLYGGVNKKYKEKGRSLLFNLKDRNNPELRERVMSGEIPPEKLCTMTAEELASEELSQWRIAKAEELAQMVVLPDAQVDIRRLVRKTHKGEFQVEFEQDDSVSVEVAIGESSLAKVPSKNNATDSQKPRKVNEIETPAKVFSGQDNVITLTPDNTDLMQGIVVEDELKDSDCFPQIVSLDEFMDSLNAEPPFENLPGDTVKTAANTSVEDKKLDNAERKMDSSTSSFGDPVNISSPDKSTKADVKDQINDSHQKSTGVAVESEKNPSHGGNKIDHIWEGLLQFNISSIVTVVGMYKSGEKTSTKEWPSFLEIKGRVRLDAFGKFLQELPLSRSRAIMIGQFSWKEGSPEIGRLNLSEVADSYTSDERVGVAEPAPGVELYLCPPHEKTVENLCNLLPKDHGETLKTIDSGLIGIIVWRRANISSTISPKLSSHHKQNSRKQHFSSLKTQRQEKDNTSRANLPSILGAPPSNNSKPTDDEEDLPPGFGPPVGREEDLPEFEFGRSITQPSGGSMPLQARQSTRPVEQMRELVLKYGQTEAPPSLDKWVPSPGPIPCQGLQVETHSWNDDDDEDDIPEWRPHEESKPHRPPLTHNPPLSLQRPVPRHQQPMYPLNIQVQSQAQQPMLQTTFHVPLQNVESQFGSQQNENLGWQQVRVWQQPYGSNSPVDTGIQPSVGGSSVNGQFYRTPNTDWRPRYP